MSASKFSNAVYMYDSNLKKVTVREFIRDNFWGFTVLVVSVFLIVLVLILGLLQKARIAEKKAKKGEQCKDRFFETYEPRYPDTIKWNYWDDQYIRALLWR